MDSASLGAIMGAHVFCHKSQRKYALVGVSERLRMLFEVGGVEKLLVIYPTAEAAQSQFAANKAAGNGSLRGAPTEWLRQKCGCRSQRV
jgi:hypothetical protein